MMKSTLVGGWEQCLSHQAYICMETAVYDLLNIALVFLAVFKNVFVAYWSTIQTNANDGRGNSKLLLKKKSCFLDL